MECEGSRYGRRHKILYSSVKIAVHRGQTRSAKAITAEIVTRLTDLGGLGANNGSHCEARDHGDLLSQNVGRSILRPFVRLEPKKWNMSRGGSTLLFGCFQKYLVI